MPDPRRTVPDGFALRVKALATTAPLTDLDARKGLQAGGDWGTYQMAELALHTIDLVTISMDFDTGADPDEIATQLAAQVAAQAPMRSDEEHAAVAEWVLQSLLNVGSADRGFAIVYGSHTSDGYTRRTFAFKLLEETLGQDGKVYLRASNEAVNVLVGALDVDLEADHMAADLRLEVLIERGQLDKAQAAAQNARYHTIRYGEHLRKHLDATTRDVRNVDWTHEMPVFLDQALTHVEGRYRAENAIMSNISRVRDDADEAESKGQAAALVDVVRDCLRRNDQLAAALQNAGRTFRAEQSRQTFTTGSVKVDLDLHGQLLVPVLQLPLVGADQALAGFFPTVTGIAVPSAMRLADLFDDLITPPTERDLLGDAITEFELDERPEPPRFAPHTYQHLADLLDREPGHAVRLSALLTQARATGDGGLALLVVLHVLSGASPHIADALAAGTPSVRFALDDGTALTDPDFAGADLLVVHATVNANPTPEPDLAESDVA